MFLCRSSCKFTCDYTTLHKISVMKKLLLAFPFAFLSLLCTSSIQAQNWNQILKASASDREDKNTSGRSPYDYFGQTVALFGDYAIVGSIGENEDANGANYVYHSGAAYVFQKVGGEWKKIRKLCSNGRPSGSYFGVSVDINDQYAVVGAYGENSREGAAYIFKKDEGGIDNWGQVKRLTAPFPAQDDYFGASVSVSGDYVAVSAFGDDEDAGQGNFLHSAGSVFLYRTDMGGQENWGQVAQVNAPKREALDSFGNHLSLDGELLVVGAALEDHDVLEQNELSAAGSAYIFGKNSGGADQWGLIKKIVAPTRAASATFGTSVDISGDYVVVGADQDDPSPGVNGPGAAYIFKRSEGGPDNWGVARKLVAPVRANEDHYGRSVSISGDYVIVGAYMEDEDGSEFFTLNGSGSAYIYKKNQPSNDNWGFVKKITERYRANSDFFGYAVGISGENAFVGAWGEDDDRFEQKPVPESGAAFFFNKDLNGTDNWGLFDKVITSTGAATPRLYGADVSISGNYAIVGAVDGRAGSSAGQKGPVYILYNNGGNWTEVKRIDPPADMTFDNFGSSVAINGNYAIVGARDGNIKFVGGQVELATSGAYIFEKDRGGRGNWGMVKSLVHSADRRGDDRYGFSVALNGEYAIVGAPGYFANNGAPPDFTGAAFLFQKDHGGSNNWGLLKTVTPLFLANGDNFGWSVAIEGNTLLVGSRSEDHDATENDPLEGAGAVYIYEKDLGGINNWGQKQKVTAPIRHAYQTFGSSVNISGDHFIVGAPYDERDVNGGNTLRYAGAAYVFKKDQGSGLWAVVKKMTAAVRTENTYFGSNVGISGDNAVVGYGFDHYDASNSNYTNLSGSVSIFNKDKDGIGNWGLSQKITAQNRYAEDRFGFAVAISGQNILVGAANDDKDFREENFLTDAGSAYIFRNSSVPLPVKLLSFDASKNENVAILKWSTTEELNSDYFEVQKSRDGFSWEALNTLKAAKESTTLRSYSYNDLAPFEGENLYRLKMVDQDGSFAYSRIRSLSFENSNALRLFPNPVSDRLFVLGSADLSKIESVQLINNLGQVVFQSAGIDKGGISVRNLAPGIYTIRTRKVGESSKYQKVMVVR